MGGALPSPSSSSEMSTAHYRTHRIFLLLNYILFGASSSCIFLILSLRLIPSAIGVLLILLHALTIAGAISGSAAASSSSSSGKWYGAHMVATVLTAILQGSVSVLVFTRTSEFLVSGLRSYVEVDDGEIILRMIGGLGVVIFCLEWAVLSLAFVLRYYAYVDGDCARRNSRVQREEEVKNWPWPLQGSSK